MAVSKVYNYLATPAGGACEHDPSFQMAVQPK